MLSGLDCESEYYEGSRLVDEDIVGCEFNGCTFAKCSFNQCRFQDCVFSECIFDTCDVVSDRFSECRMRYCGFKSCTLLGVNVSSLLSGPLSPIEYAVACTLKYCIFEDVPLIKVKMKGSNILESSFDRCDLRDADLSGCKLDGTVFGGCNLEGADFRQSVGYNINVRDCKVKGARFSSPEALRLLDPFGVKID